MAKSFFGQSYDIAEAIENYIASQGLAEGCQLPPERELTALFGVNRQALRAAIRQLCNEGVLYTIQGKGTFLAPKKYEIPLGKIMCFRDALVAAPYDYKVHRVYERMTAPKDYGVMAFALEENQQLLTQLNIYTVNEEPIAYETVYILDPNLEGVSKNRVKFTITKTTEEESLFLGLSQKADVLLERTYAYKNNSIIQLFSTIIVATRVTFVMENFAGQS